MLNFDRRLKSGLIRKSEGQGDDGAFQALLKPLIDGDRLDLWLKTEKEFANEQLQAKFSLRCLHRQKNIIFRHFGVQQGLGNAWIWMKMRATAVHQ